MLKSLPDMPGITKETAKNLKWKSLKYLVKHDLNHTLPRYFLKAPFRYSFNLIKSWLKKKSYRREKDFFFYGLEGKEAFQKAALDPEALIVVGFSYCHKPFECPSQRFSAECIADHTHPVCSQCFIGKMVHALPSDRVMTLFIPTIHYIGEKMFEITHQNPHKKIIFLITACEMTLEMFGDWGNMVGARGIGVRLSGRICNTMKAFELSEAGIKPGLTLVHPDTEKELLNLISTLR